MYTQHKSMVHTRLASYSQMLTVCLLLMISLPADVWTQCQACKCHVYNRDIKASE